MTRGFHADLNTASRATSPAPAVLVAIETGDAGTPWIRMTSTETDFVFPDAGDTYTARPFEFGEFEVASGAAMSMQLKLADVDDYWDTWLATTDFRWKTCKRYRIDRAVVDSVTKAQLDTFRIVNRTRTDREFVFTLEPRMAILQRIRVPGQILTREEFPGIPDSGPVG